MDGFSPHTQARTPCVCGRGLTPKLAELFRSPPAGSPVIRVVPRTEEAPAMARYSMDVRKGQPFSRLRMSGQETQNTDEINLVSDKGSSSENQAIKNSRVNPDNVSSSSSSSSEGFIQQAILQTPKRQEVSNPMMSGVMSMQLELTDLEKSRNMLQNECDMLRQEQRAQVMKLAAKNNQLSREVQNLREHLAELEKRNKSHEEELKNIQQMKNDREETLLSLLQAKDMALSLVEKTEKEMKELESQNELLSHRIVAKDMERRVLHNDLQELRGCVRVVVRVRPPGVCKTNALLEKDKMYTFLKNATKDNEKVQSLFSPSSIRISSNLLKGSLRTPILSSGSSRISEDKDITNNSERKSYNNDNNNIRSSSSNFEISYPDRNQDRRQIELTLPSTIESYSQSVLSSTTLGTQLSQTNTYSFELEHVFCETDTQRDVYDTLAPLVQSALDGYRVCIFAYGQTGSGKTFTMLGSEDVDLDCISRNNDYPWNNSNNNEQKTNSMKSTYAKYDDELVGVIPRAIKHLFALKRQYEQDGWDINITMSMLEIYNEKIRDLLKNAINGTYAAGTTTTTSNGSANGSGSNSNVPSSNASSTNTTINNNNNNTNNNNINTNISQNSNTSINSNGTQYKITYSPTTGDTVVQNLTYVPVIEESEVLRLLKTCTSKRAVGVTDCNKVSSRSHTVFTLSISSRTTTQQGKIRELFGQINLVDLAGSESLKRSHSEGERLKETKHINTSLYELGNVIVALGKGEGGQQGNGNRHIPYRNSLLTMLLKPALSPGAKTLTIVTVSGDEADGNETLNSLRFAAKLSKCRIGVGERRSRLLNDKK